MTPEVPAPGVRVSLAGAWLAVLGLAPLALTLGVGCAPHPGVTPALTGGAREAQFRAALAQREARGQAMNAAVTLWVRAPNSRVWPGVTAALTLRAPDASRLRVASVLGTAFDGAVRGDSVLAVLPTRGLGFAADASRDPLGLKRPGVLGFRMLAAAWRPPDDAWARGRWSADTLALLWMEEGDSLRLAIGPDGLPLAVVLERGDSLRVRVAYRGWKRHARIAWPSWIELELGSGALFARCKIDRLRFVTGAGPSRPMMRLPAGATTSDWPEFRRALERAWGPR